jgi:uncharacterized integral membrane protein
MKRIWILKGIGIMLFVVSIVLLIGFIVQNLWNSIVSPVFSLPALTLAQATGLFILAKILTGGLFHPAGGFWRHRRHWRDNFKNRWKERWDNMTPEEKEKLKQMYWGKCGYFRERQERMYRTEKEEQL